jgi:hypothetical protein
VKTIRERENERRQEKLRDMRRQIRDGSLVVRRMTAKERAAAREALDRRKQRS